MLTAELFAIEMKSTKIASLDKVWYSHFYYHKQLLEMCLPGHKIVKVRLTELESPEENCYWSWKKLLSNDLKSTPLDPPEFHFTCCHIHGVEMCFAYGSKVEEARGRGKVVPVRMEILETLNEASR